MNNLELAAAAWNAVRNRDDAPWINLSVEMRGKLLALAEKYSRGAKVAEGDYPPEGFAEKVWELGAAADVAVGDPIVFLESPPQMAPRGLSHEISKPLAFPPGLRTTFSAEHEDTRIPSPNPEDVDPLRDETVTVPIKVDEQGAATVPAFEVPATVTEFDTAGADTPKPKRSHQKKKK